MGRNVTPFKLPEMKATLHCFILVILSLFFTTPGFSQVQLGEDIDGTEHSEKSGFSISLASSGKRIAIGAPLHFANNTLPGHVKVFEWLDGAWVQAGSTISGEAPSDGFGYVSLSADGQRLAVGANLNDGAGGKCRPCSGL